jgi:hypothetical protein
MEQRLPLARRLIAAGKLPAHADVKTYGGAGTGRACGLCAELIPRTAVEIEVVDLASAHPGLTLHPDCYGIWLAAVREEAST